MLRLFFSIIVYRSVSSAEYLLKTYLFKFFSTDDRRILLLASVVLLLALGAVKLSQFISADMLRADALSTVSAWAGDLTETADDIPAVIAGAAPSGKTEDLLNDATKVGDIYRYKIADRSGRTVFNSERASFHSVAKTNVDGRWKRIVDSVLSGATFTELGSGKSSENPPYFVRCYLPLKKDGAVIGIMDVYIDQTEDHAIYGRSLILTESIMAIMVLLAGGVPGFVVYRKMRDHRKAQAEALFLAEHDSLTGLANRKMLAETAHGALAWNRRNNGYVAALVVDLDRFKEINDTFGHSVGDEVLKTVAARLKSAVRVEDIVARLGGDEFVVLQIGMNQPDGATYLATRLLKLLAEPIEINELQLVCAASMGVAISPADTEDWEELLSRADIALYRAKEEGRGNASFFETGMDAMFRERRRLESELRRAMDTKAFHLAYQPLINFRGGELVGFEALLRWPEGWEPQSPATFIPVAEEAGLIVPIGAWVLKTACHEAAAWTKPLKIAVNLSPLQFSHGDIVAVVDEALRSSGLDPERLELEVTESLWLQNTEAVLDQLTRLRSRGISIALDDFGTGYSSLSYLWKFPFDKVKVDRSFVTQMEIDPKAAAIVDTVVALGRTLDLTITAEGVETQEQAEALKRAGCDEGQGYLFSRPLSASATIDLINSSASITVHSSVSHAIANELVPASIEL
jgi:diguanylate cyclase (GGDEF)-like protein